MSLCTMISSSSLAAAAHSCRGAGVSRQQMARSPHPTSMPKGAAPPAGAAPFRSSSTPSRMARRGTLQVSAAIKRGSEKNVVCCKTMVAKEDEVDAVVRLCEGLTTFSKAAMADRSSGILAWECSRDPFEPHVFYTWERYASNAALGKHNTSDDVKAFMEQVNGHLQQPVGLALYEWQDGQLGAACVQGGPKGEGGLDDATGASGAAGGAGLKQTSATVNLGEVRRGDEGDAFGLQPPKWAKALDSLPWFGKGKDKKKAGSAK